MELLQKAINTISPLSKESWAIFLNGWKHRKLSMAGIIDKMP